MAIDDELRHSNRPADAGMFPVRALAALALVALAAAVGVLVSGSSTPSVAAPAFLRAPLGVEGGDDRYEPVVGVEVELGRSGYLVRGAAGQIGVASEDATGGDWRHFERGAVRSTPFGSETVVVTPTRTEQFLTIDERQGSHTWRWPLETGRLTPKLKVGGSVLVAAGPDSAGLRIAPVAILDGTGRDVTPAKARWELDRSGAEWFLTLDLDDATLPLPYVIDPAVDYPATQYLRNTASTTQTDVPDYTMLTTSGTLSTTTVTIWTGTAPANPFLQFRPATTLWATRGAPGLAPPNGRGWIVDAGGAATPNDTVIPAGNWTFRVRTDANGTSMGGPMNMAFGLWKVTTAAGSITTSTMFVDPNAAGSRDNLSLLASTATQTVNHVIALPEISLTANEHILLQLYGWNSANLWTSRTLSLYYNDANSYVQHTAATTRPSVPAQVTPANAAFPNTTTPTLTATFSDPDAADTGTVNFSVCSDAACSSVISTFSSASGIANGANGSAAVPGAAGLVNGTTYYWQAQNQDDSSVLSAFSASRSFTVDTTAPAVPSLAISESNAASHASGSTFYYRPAGAGGTFTATATTSDAVSLVKHVTFPGLAGGFTPAGATIDTTSVYSQVYTWPATTGTETGAKNVTAEDNATNISSAGTFTVTPDSAVPVSGALTVNSVAASAGGTQSYDGDGAFTIGTRTDYTDAISGIATSTLTREQGTLSADSCSAYGAPTTIAGNPAQSSLATGCYRYVLTGTDNVGNAVTITTTVKVDTSAPAAPGLSLSDSSAAVHTTGTTAFYRPAGSGAFDVAASSTDAQSGILDYSFPALAGFTISGSGASRTYTLATPTEPDGGKPVTARNQTLLNSGASNFTLTSDSAIPVSGALTVNGVAAAGGGSQSYDGDGAFTIGTRTDYTDAISGIASSTLTREDGTLNADACSAYGAPATIVGSPAQSGLATGCYRFVLTGTDNVGNAVSITTTVKVDTSAPAAPGLILADSSAAVHTTGTTAFYQPAGAGSFDVTASSTDAQSGILDYSFPALTGFTSSGAGASRTYTLATPTEPNGTKPVTARNQALLNSTATNFTLTSDSAIPVSGALTVNGVAAAGGGSQSYDGDGAFTIGARADYTDATSGIASSTLTREQGTLNADACSAYAAPSTIVGTPAQSGLATGCYRFVLTGTDNVGNATTITTIVKVDTSAPAAPSLLLADSSAAVHTTGTTAFYRPAGAGSFDVTASSTDAQSGILDYVFSDLAGFDESSVGSTVTYTLNSPTEPDGTKNVTARNQALLTTGATFTLTADSAVPVSGALTVNGVAASVGGSQSYDGDGAFTIGARTDYTDAISGIATSTLTRELGTLNADACSAYGAPTTIVGTPAQSGLATGCYRYTLIGTDNVGNQASAQSTVVKVDTTAPSVPSLTLSNVTGDTYYSGSGSTIWFRPAGSGQFDVSASATDADTNVASYGFPALGSGWTPSGAGAARTYAFAPGAAEPGARPVTATNGAGSTSAAATFTVSADVDAPADGALTVNGTAASGPGTASWDTDGSFPIDVRTDWTDAGSGLVSSPLVRESATLSGGVCGSFSSPATLTGAPAQSGLADGCYRYTLTGTDNLGGQSSISTVVRVDSAAPTSSLEAAAAYSLVTAITLTYTAADGGSGLAAVELWAKGPSDSSYALVATDTSPVSASFSYTAAQGDGTYLFYTRARDAAGSTEDAPASPPDTQTVVDTAKPASAADALPTYSADPAITVAYTSSDATSGVDDVELWARGPSDSAYALVATDTTPASASFDYTAAQGNGLYRFYTVARDNGGNSEDVPGSADAATTLDTSFPSDPALSFGSFTNASATGTTVYIREGVAGGFTVTSDSDAPSGIDFHTFPSLGGSWTGGGVVAGDPAAKAYTFTASDTAPAGPHAVTATNGVGATNPGTSTFSVVADTTAPTSTVACDGGACSAGWYTSAPVTVTLSGNDAGAGVQAIRYTTDGSDPSPINGTVYLSAINVSATTAIRYRAYDAVGNEGAIQNQAIQVDASAPSAPALTLDESDADSHVVGSTLFYNPSGSRAGTFTVTATSADAQSGIAKLAFPALAGATGGGDDTTSPYVGSYSWDSSTTASGAQTVTGHNGAGLTSASTFTMTADTTAPSPTISCNAAACSAGWYTTSPVSVTLSSNDAGAGLRELRYTTDGSDPLSGTIYLGAFSVVTTSTVRIAAIDEVGNAATPASTPIQIDTSAPAATMTDPGANLRGTVALGSTSADPQSGVATVTYQRSPAGAGTWTNTAASWNTTLVADGLYDLRVVVVNGAGLSTTSAVVANRRVDNTLPTATMSNPGNGNHEGTITLNATATDTGGSGVANVVIQYSPAGDNIWTTVGTDTSSPYSANWNTTTVPDGRYDLRAISTDNAGNARTSNVVANVKVANNPPIVTITSPQAFVNAASPATFTITADAWGAGGSAPRHVEFFRCSDASVSCSGGSWVSLGQDSTEPYSISWAQSSEPEGNRALKATVTDQNWIEASDVNNITIDRIAPTGQSATLTAGPWYGAASVALTLDNGTDGGSGIDGTSQLLERQQASLAAASCDTFGGWSSTSNPDTTVLSGTCYRYRLTVSDLAGNASAASGSSAAAKVDLSAPSAPALSFSGLTNASVTGSTVYVRSGAAGGFTVSGSSTDSQSSVSAYGYPALGTGWTESVGAYTFASGAADPAEPNNVTATNPAGLTSAPTSFTVTPDGTAPVSSIACSGGCGGWHPATPVTVTLSASDGGSGVSQILYSTDGSAPSTVYAGPFAVSAQGTTTVRFAATDAVGNAETAQSQTVRIDTTAATAPALAFSAFSNAVASGNDVFYNPALAGGFSLTPTSTDGESGVSSYSLPALGAGWSESAGAYTFASGAADPVEPLSVTATNGSGLISAGTQFTVSADSIAPSTTATCNGAACSAGWYTSSPVSVALSASDGGAGVDQIRYTTDGSDPTILTGSVYLSAIDVASEGTTTVKFRAFDRVGNTEAVQTVLVRLDTIDPETTIDSGPSGSLSDTAAAFTFSSNEVGSTFECRLDGGAFAACSSPKSYSGLVDGSHTFQVRAVDPALRTDATPASRTWTVDTVAADTTITSAPAASTSSTNASFSFTASDAGPSFQCKLDAGAFTACTSPGSYTGLVEGSHTFSVRAIDAAGNLDATPATHTWTVDTTAPDTTIVTAPSNPSANATPTFSFDSTESPATYEVNLDSAGWVAAATPLTISPALADASHTLQVRASDAAGNQDASASSHTWTVDTTAPTGSLTAPAAGADVSGSAVTVSSDSADALSGVLNALFERSPAGAGTWTAIGVADTSAPYSVSWDTTGLTDGDYDLRVTTRDVAGNQFVAATRTVTVDNTVPTLSVSVPDPVNLATPDPASITAIAGDTGTGIASVNFEQCSEGSATCTSDTWTPLGLDTTAPYGVSWAIPSDGMRLIRVRATDGAGRQATELVLANIDRIRPTGALTAPAAGANLRGSSVALTATASDTTPGTVNTVTFQRSPAGAGTWTDAGSDLSAPYTATLDTTALADGLYDLRVFTTDSAGNAEAAPATIQVRVDNTLPTGSVTNPAAAANVRGSIALTSNSADAGSGVDTVQFQRSPAGAGTWTNQVASFDTTLVADGQYDLRVVTTDNAGNTFTSVAITARVDNTLPTGSVTSPAAAANVRGTIALTSNSADTGSGVDTVVFQRSSAGAGTWTNQAAGFNTTLVADGQYDLRVVTTDNAGNVFTSSSITVRVDNTLPTGNLTAPADGAEIGVPPVTLTSDSADPLVSGSASGVDTVVFERRVAGSGAWTPTPASWDTASGSDAVADGSYELRVTTTDNAGNSFSSGFVTVLVDHTAPDTSASLAPGSPSNAPVTVSFSAGDGSGSGVGVTSYSVDSGSLQQGAAVVIGAPGDHSNDGSHVIEFFSTDQVGNIEPPNSVTVVIDTTAPSGTAGDPGDYLRGIAILTYSTAAIDVSSVQFQFSPAAAGSWSNIGGADIAPPYEASWNTVLVADGPYDLRAVVTDSTGNVANVLLPGLPKTVDNTAPTGAVTAPAAAAYVSGSVDVMALGTDGVVPPASGVSAVRFEVKPAGAGTFTVFGTQTIPVVGSTYRQSLATGSLADGAAELRVVVTDVAGNEMTSATHTVNVDNEAPAVTLDDPGPAVSGTLTLGVSTSLDTAQVLFERSPAGAGSWTAIGTDSTAGDGFTSDLNTATLTDGLYDLRARATDGGGNSATSATQTTLLDNTLPTGAVTSPAVSAVVGGPAVLLVATAADTSGSGVDAVAFEVKTQGSGTFVSLDEVNAPPYELLWDATAAPDGTAEIRVVVTDAAGNALQSNVVPVSVDSTGPSVTLNDPGAVASGTVNLTTSTGGGAVRVSFGRSPAGASTWIEISSDTSAPFAASLDTSTLADGLYDLRAVGYDALGNASTPSLRAGVRFDNTAPQLVTSAPADGSVSASASQIVLTASEPVTVAGVLLDGAATPAPTISGSTLTFATGALGDGLHVLSGELEDASGRRIPFRVAVAIEGTPVADRPPVELSADPAADSTLVAPGSLASVTLPPAAWPLRPSADDFVVLRIDLAPPPPSVGPGLLPGTQLVEVTAFWGLAGTKVTAFETPIDIVIPNPSGEVVVPSTSQTGASWRILAALGGPTLPAGQSDGYYRDATGSIHILTRHLTYFSLLRDNEAPTAPRDVAGVVAGDGLTIRWIPGTDSSGQLSHVVLFVNGQPYRNFGTTQFEVKMGAFSAADTRTFTLVQVDAAGSISPHTKPLRRVPQLAGRSLERASASLVAAGFSVGSVREETNALHAPGTVIDPANLRLALESSSIDLVVARAPDTAPQTRLVLSVAGAKKLALQKRTTIAVRVKVSRPANLTATLFGTNKQRLYTWRLRVKAGATVVKLRLPTQIRRPGTYTISLVARSGTETSRRAIKVKLVGAKLAQVQPRKQEIEVVLAGEQPPKNALQPGRGMRVVASANPDQTFALAASAVRNVGIVVVDVDAYGVLFVGDLHTVFPALRLIAIAREPVVRHRSIRAGAVLALPRSTSSQQLANAIVRVAGR